MAGLSNFRILVLAGVCVGLVAAASPPQCPISISQLWTTGLSSGVVGTPILHSLRDGSHSQIIIPGAGDFLFALETDGYPAPGWPVEFPSHSFLTSPTTFDFNGDGYDEILVASTSGYVLGVSTTKEGIYDGEMLIKVPRMAVKKDWYVGLEEEVFQGKEHISFPDVDQEAKKDIVRSEHEHVKSLGRPVKQRSGAAHDGLHAVNNPDKPEDAAEIPDEPAVRRRLQEFGDDMSEDFDGYDFLYDEDFRLQPRFHGDSWLLNIRSDAVEGDSILVDSHVLSAPVVVNLDKEITHFKKQGDSHRPRSPGTLSGQRTEQVELGGVENKTTGAGGWWNDKGGVRGHHLVVATGFYFDPDDYANDAHYFPRDDDMFNAYMEDEEEPQAQKEAAEDTGSVEIDPSNYIASGVGVFDLLNSEWLWMEALDLTASRSPLKNLIYGTPTVADIDGDGLKEIIVGSTLGMIYVMDATGGSLEHWPQQIGSISGQVAAADIHPDIGKLEIVAVGHDGVVALTYDGKVLWAKEAELSDSGGPLIVDLDDDGELDVVAAGAGGLGAPGDVLVYAWKGRTGDILPGFPIEVDGRVVAPLTYVALSKAHAEKVRSASPKQEAPEQKESGGDAAGTAGQQSEQEAGANGIQVEEEDESGGYEPVQRRRLAAAGMDAATAAAAAAAAQRHGAQFGDHESQLGRLMKSIGNPAPLYVIVPTTTGKVYFLGYHDTKPKVFSPTDKHNDSGAPEEEDDEEPPSLCISMIDTGEPITSGVIAGDMDGDGTLELVVTSTTGHVIALTTHTRYHRLFGHKSLPGWGTESYGIGDRGNQAFGVYISLPPASKARGGVRAQEGLEALFGINKETGPDTASELYSEESERASSSQWSTLAPVAGPRPGKKLITSGTLTWLRPWSTGCSVSAHTHVHEHSTSSFPLSFCVVAPYVTSPEAHGTDYGLRYSLSIGRLVLAEGKLSGPGQYVTPPVTIPFLGQSNLQLCVTNSHGRVSCDTAVIQVNTVESVQRLHHFVVWPIVFACLAMIGMLKARVGTWGGLFGKRSKGD